MIIAKRIEKLFYKHQETKGLQYQHKLGPKKIPQIQETLMKRKIGDINNTNINPTYSYKKIKHMSPILTLTTEA